MRDRSKHPVFLMPHMDELDLSIPTQRVEDAVQCVSDNSVASLYAGALQHFPHEIGYIFGHHPSAGTALSPAVPSA
jgi:hypothetical protein